MLINFQCVCAFTQRNFTLKKHSNFVEKAKLLINSSGYPIYT